jgi:hypothetical protein
MFLGERGVRNVFMLPRLHIIAMRMELFLAGLIVFFTGEMIILPSFRFVPLSLMVVGIIISAAGFALKKKTTSTQMQ